MATQRRTEQLREPSWMNGPAALRTVRPLTSRATVEPEHSDVLHTQLVNRNSE